MYSHNFLISQRFQVVLEAKNGNAFSGEISLEKIYFNLVHLKAQVRVFLMTYYFFCIHYSGAHGVGRIDIVENRYVGMKSRGKLNSGPTPSFPSCFRIAKNELSVLIFY